MTNEETDTLILKAANEEWGLFRSKVNLERLDGPEYFLIWIGDTPPNEYIPNACKKLARQMTLINGVLLTFVDQPEVGLIIRPKPGWNFEEGEGAKHLFDKVLWEINRLSGATKS